MPFTSIDDLVQQGDSAGLAELLKTYPALENDFFTRAMQAIERTNFWEAPVFALALARSNSDRAQPILGQLLAAPAWRKIHDSLDDDEVLSLAVYLIGRRSPLLSALFQACPPGQAAKLEQVLQAAHPEVWLDLLWQRADGDDRDIIDRLRRQPALQERFLQRTLQELQRGHVGDALRVLKALRACDSPHAWTLLERLTAAPGGLSGLDRAAALDLISFVGRQPKLLMPLLRALSGETFKALPEHLDGPAKEAWVYLALEREDLYADAADQLAGLRQTQPLEEIAPDAGPIVLNQALDAALLDLMQELARTSLTGDAETLLRRVWLLTRLCQRRVSLELGQAIAGRLPQVSAGGLWAAAGLLGQVPRREWIEPLRAAWFRLEAISIAHEKHERTRMRDVPVSVLELASFEVAGALGAAGAENADYHDLTADNKLTTRYEQLRDELNARIDEYNERVTEFRASVAPPSRFTGQGGMSELLASLLGQETPAMSWSRPSRPSEGLAKYLPSGDQQSRQVEQLKDMRRVIERLEQQADQAYQQVRNGLSPGAVLRNVLLNGQRHGAGIRQAAAWGLYRLLRDGHLNADAARALRQQVVTVLNDDQALRERRVHLPARCGRAEMLFCLEDGLGWVRVMEQLRQAPVDDEAALKPAEQTIELERLKRICDLAHRHLPGAVAFFQSHPLRLMNLDDHQQMLGNYLSNGAELQRWVYFNPPRDVGKVHERYLRLEDRSTPNSMGIHHGLFRHELLALPVLYHEFLHYGGTSGEPGGGIANEMEVRFREMLFHRALLAELAPKDDGQLPAYEASLAEAARAAGCPCLLVELLHDYQDDAELARLNEAIAATYGQALDREEALGKAVQRLDEHNRATYVINRLQPWDPLVTWPMLEPGDPLTHTYTDILVRRRMQDHTLSPQRREQILAEPQSRRACELWDSYRHRPRALEVLRAEAEQIRTALEQEALYRLLVRRFPFLLPEERPVEHGTEELPVE